MSSTYVPSDTFKDGAEKDWPSKLGSLDWDFTRIVFTKRTLIEFLRYMGTSVDPNLHNIAKLPRYADFGTLVDGGDASVPGVSKAADQGNVVGSPDADAFKPSRRVRTVPGGPQSFTLGDGSEDVFAAAPSQTLESLSISDEHAEKSPEGDSSAPDAAPGDPAFKPSRRVRTGPGGPSSMANLWDDYEAEPFKPTRRVREGPGGVDSISQIF